MPEREFWGKCNKCKKVIHGSLSWDIEDGRKKINFDKGLGKNVINHRKTRRHNEVQIDLFSAREGVGDYGYLVGWLAAQINFGRVDWIGDIFE